MASLADITSELRIVLKILGIAAVAIFAIFLFVKGGQIAKDLFFPTPPPPPEEKFGKLPEVTFPSQNSISVKYKINTLNGQLPATGTLPGNIPDRMKVYKVKAQTASLVALSQVRETLKNSIRFEKNEAKISDAVYRWTNDDGAAIQYNIVTNNFRISSNYLSGPLPTRLSGAAATKEGAYDRSIEFLESIRGDTSDLEPTNVKGTYLKVQNGLLVGATSQSDAQFIRVDIFQKDLDKKKIYYPGFTTSPIYFIFRNENDTPKIVEAAFFHYAASEEASEYGIKTAEQAFADLQAGKALVRLTSEKSEVDITDVNLGYYLSEDDPQYFLPIFVFSGNDVTAYVNALANQ